ncbi:MAG: TRAP transporter substrate-binding protein [Eubacteriales bacterium]|nr:TRAP transporter substrate-binding protein [Eubacteriales bacterium]
MKKLFAIVLALTMVFALCSVASADFDSATYLLNLPTAENDQDAFYSLAKHFADNVSEMTDGAVTIEIHANAQLGSGADAVMGVEMGTIDFNVDSTNTLVGEYSKLSFCDLPYMFDNVDQIMAFCASEHMAQMQEEVAEQLGVRILCFGDGGFRAVWSTKGAIHSIDDFKGLKIRVPDVKIYVDTFNAIGANATPMAGSEVFTAIQQGAIDAAEFPVAVGISMGYMEAVSHVTMDKHFYNLIGIQMAESTWEKMSPELQEVITAAAQKAQEEQIEAMAAVADSLVEKLEENGIVYTAEDDVDLTAVREACQPVYESYRDSIGPEFYDACMAWFEANR